MQYDLMDAVAWAIDHGIADANRLAIMGYSYGGYATLVGLSSTPEVFACGVDMFGLSNLQACLENTPPYWESSFENLAHRIGDPRTEEGRKLLRERSPFYSADRIIRPVLIAQGANDTRVTPAESERVVEVMRRNGQPVTYLLYPDEGHGFVRPENNLSFVAIMEAFLAAHLGGQHEGFDADISRGTVQVIAGASHIPGLAETLARETSPATSPALR